MSYSIELHTEIVYDYLQKLPRDSKPFIIDFRNLDFYQFEKDGKTLLDIMYLEQIEILLKMFAYTNRTNIVKFTIYLLDKYQWEDRDHTIKLLKNGFRFYTHFNNNQKKIFDFACHELEFYKICKTKDIKSIKEYGIKGCLNEHIFYSFFKNDEFGSLTDYLIDLEEIENVYGIINYYKTLDEDNPYLTQILIDKKFDFYNDDYDSCLYDTIINKDFYESFILLPEKGLVSRDYSTAYSKSPRIFNHILESSRLIYMYITMEDFYNEEMANIIINKLLESNIKNPRYLISIYIHEYSNIIKRIFDIYPNVYDTINKFLLLIEFGDLEINDYVYYFYGFDRIKNILTDTKQVVYSLSYSEREVIDFYLSKEEFVEYCNNDLIQLYIKSDEYLHRLKKIDPDNLPLTLLDDVPITSVETIKYLLDISVFHDIFPTVEKHQMFIHRFITDLIGVYSIVNVQYLLNILDYMDTIDYKYDFSKYNNIGYNCLHLAFVVNNDDIIEYMIKKVDSTLKILYGVPVIIVGANDLNSIKCFIKYGIDLTVSDSGGKTLFDILTVTNVEIVMYLYNQGYTDINIYRNNIQFEFVKEIFKHIEKF